METKFTLKTSENHLIYGTLNDHKSSQKLIIFVHGLTGHQNEHIFYNAAQFFPQRGFSTVRFDLYSGEKKGRKLSECSLKTHADDLNIVINFFSKKFKLIFLVGHSLGGPTILKINLKKVKSIVLWDPSLGLQSLIKETTFNTCLGKYVLSWGTEYLISSVMIEEWKSVDREILREITKPIKIICAGNGVLYKEWEKKISMINKFGVFKIIKKAGHCFDEERVEKELFEETLAWFKR